MILRGAGGLRGRGCCRRRREREAAAAALRRAEHQQRHGLGSDRSEACCFASVMCGCIMLMMLFFLFMMGL